jgi:xylulose-5-phosphate/fructose-6-phosphate phosphoketolase
VVASQTAINKLSAFGTARSTIQGAPLTDIEAQQTQAFFRACNFLALGMIYLQDNPLLREPLRPEHIKNRLLGHWGASPALSFIYTHLNRVIKRDDLDMIFMAGPGMARRACSRRSTSKVRTPKSIPKRVWTKPASSASSKIFLFPGYRQPLHSGNTGSIHEGGELGYVLSHACGAAFDNPDLVVAAVVGDGEAETGPLATSWHINKFLNPIRDGAVLPILNLNGYKINNPTLLARISHEELEDLFKGYGYTPLFVEGSDPRRCTRRWRRLWITVSSRFARPSARRATLGSRRVRGGR